ncbi:MAG: hypothetical protein FJ118_15575 [Deltaproteobacteria bacterium]|nr:hypothetical protein [Deltaproteobacteria bacterium]
MKARYLDNGTIEVSGAVDLVKFNRIWAGIGWPEKEPGCLCVVGERTDNRYHALWEKQGGLVELADAAIEARDRFLIERVLVDPGDELSTSYLRSKPGLCFPETREQDSTILGPGNIRPKPAVSLNTRSLCVVAPVLGRVLENYRSALEKTRAVIMEGRLLIHETNCPGVLYALRQPLEDLLKSPTMKALVWVVTALEMAQGNGDLAEISQEPWYVNVPRDSG